ncbi:response regulator [Candidatus Margulisiibacteriota bacterium]
MNEKKLILLLEDEETVQKNVVKMIKNIKDPEGREKYDVLCAANGKEALKILKKHSKFFGFAGNEIKGILLDLRMPEMDGQQFLRKFRKIESRSLLTRYTPVVFLTAYEDDEKWASAVEGMATDYIKKPLSQDKLEKTMETIFDKHDAEILTEATRQKGIKEREQYNERSAGEITESKQQEPTKKSPKSKLIMLVEDEEVPGKNVVRMISNIKDEKGRSKYDILWAKNGLEAFKLLRKNRRFLGYADNKIKCIFLDLRMPEMDGIQFINKLRRIENRKLFSRFIPIVFLTAYEDEKKIKTAIRNMVSDYITKPLSRIKLEDTLHRLFDTWDAETFTEITKEKLEEKKKSYQEKKEEN